MQIKKLLALCYLMLVCFSLRAEVKKVKHVVLIGCDGFGAYALPEADMPNLKKLMTTGAWSLEARAVLRYRAGNSAALARKSGGRSFRSATLIQNR
ncbi:hypothetical protein [Olivibacter sp. SDN3]|uniref:hypothetical protein n=1 Tax=Olivibacter sp. SDN3 TaxID=2764720 RepID=UPI001C9E2DFD|nr:hypothetical protein [Olivibacter sp. SDN3]